MATKEVALAAADDALREGIKTTATTLVTNLLLASSDDDRALAMERHKRGLELWKEAHEASVAVINELFS